MKDNYIVTKANDLIEASYKLNTTEQRIILLLASKIQPSDEDFRLIKFKIKDFIDTVGIKSNNIHQEIDEATKNLTKKGITVRKNDKAFLHLNWLSSAEYIPREGIVELEFSTKLKPFLLQLRERFTSYELQYILKLKSRYSIRIYELCKQYEKIKERIFEVENLRHILGIEEESYPRYSNFKQKVVNVACNEINDNTDLNIDIEEIKIGRRVEKIKFIIKSKKVCPVETIEEKQEETEDPVLIANVNTLKALFGIESLTDKDILNILNVAEGNMAKVIEKYMLIKNKNGIDNFVGLMIAAIKDNYNEVAVARETEKKKTKTKFHNFEERFENYSEKELEQLVIENQKKKFGA